VLAASLRALLHFVRQRTRFRERRVWPVVWDAVSEHRDLGLDAWIVAAADDLDDAADRVLVLFRVLEHLDAHDVAGRGAEILVARDQHVGALVAVLEHPVDAALAAETADDRALAPREDLDEMSLAAPRRLARAHGDAVAVQKTAHLARREVDVVVAVVGREEAETVAVRLNDAGDEVEVPHEAVLALAVEQELAVADHRAHPRLERAAMLLRADLESGGDRFERERPASLLHHPRDLVAARDLVLVAAFLLGVVAVARRARHDRRPLR